MSRASHSTFDRAWTAPSYTLQSPRYDERPVPFEIDFDTMLDVVRGATWITLPPVSWCCPSPRVRDRQDLAVRPLAHQVAGRYFMVSFEPRFPSSHSMCAPWCTSARCVTRLYMLFDQFWIVV